MISPAFRTPNHVADADILFVDEILIVKYRPAYSRTCERNRFNTAVGVSAPVRPTLISISKSVVSFSSGGYLNAAAHFGYFAVAPRRSLSDKLFTFTTAPSISNGVFIAVLTDFANLFDCLLHRFTPQIGWGNLKSLAILNNQVSGCVFQMTHPPPAED